MIPIRIWHLASTVFGVVALACIVLFVIGFTLCGCGGGVIVEHARGARLTGEIIQAARGAIDAARDADLDACTDEPCLDAGEARWAPGIVAYNLSVDAWNAWMDGISLANVLRDSDEAAREVLVPLLLALMRAWEGVVESLEPLEELDLPDLPNLSVLLGGR